jgi:hypothetical protein
VEPTFTEPTDPEATVTQTQVRIWGKQVNKHVKRGTMLAENLKTAYLLIYGQCSNAMRAKLESRLDHLAIEGMADSIRLLKNIRTVMFHFQLQRYNPLALHKAKHRFYQFSQDQHMMCQQYHETFRNNVDIIEYCGGVLSKDTGLVDTELTLMGLTCAMANNDKLQDAKDAAWEQVLACAFLLGSDRVCYGKLIEDLENNFTQGVDNYLPTLHQAYTLLVHWKQDPRNMVRLMGGVNDGVAFTNIGGDGALQEEGSTRGGGRCLRSEIWCYNCGSPGHIAQECPHRNSGGDDTMAMQLLMQGAEDLNVEESFQFAQVKGKLPRSWVLLDNQSMVNIFYNKALLWDVHVTTRCMHVQCNTGWTAMNLIGQLPGYPGKVWYNPDRIANILSLADTEKYFRVQYDSNQERGESLCG